MDSNSFIYLPSDIIMEILSKLPAQAILSYKFVCKSLRDLVEIDDFANFHLSKSLPGLTLNVWSYGENDGFIEVTDVVDIQYPNPEDVLVNTIMKLYFNDHAYIMGSTDGLLRVQMVDLISELFLCNPITREYIDLVHPHSQWFEDSDSKSMIYEFGVSKTSGQYKVIAILSDLVSLEAECKVYTVGTRSWRSIAPHAGFSYNIFDAGVFLKGNLHWLAYDSNYALWISCFDLETELFTTYSFPSFIPNDITILNVFLYVVEDSLCLVDFVSDDNSIIIWFMKEYGVDKSWTKQLVIPKTDDHRFTPDVPIGVFEDGAIYTTSAPDSLFYLSTKNETTERICSFSAHLYFVNSHRHTPSFRSLKSFEMENLNY